MDYVALWVPIITSLGFFALVGWIFWVFYRRRLREIESRENFYPHLMNKFANVKEFTEFLSTPEGERVLQVFAPRTRSFKERTLVWMNIGIVIFLFGCAFIVTGILGFEDLDIIEPGLLFAFPGLGLIISSILGLFMGKRWGLNDERNE